jgi:putative peptidoglycan lipid II flippase
MTGAAREGDRRDARRRLTLSAGVVAIAVMASRLLGLAREVVLAHLFATGIAFDAFNAAFRIPNVLRDLFAEGALSKSFVTTFAETSEREGDAATWRLASRALNLLVLVSLAVALVGIVFAPAVVALLAPGEGFDIPLPPAESYGFATKRDLTVFLTRVTFGFLPLVALAAIAMGVLNAKERFAVPALASACFNVGSIAVGIAGYALGPSVGLHPVAGMAFGVIAGGLAQWLVQVPEARAVGFRWTPEIDMGDAGVRRLLGRMAPAAIGVAGVQMNLFANTVFASVGAGWLSWLNVAFRLIYLPIGIFGVAISTASLPALARAAATGDEDAFRDTLGHALRLVLFLTAPASAGLAILAVPVIGLIYEHGAFTSRDAEMAGAALFYYALGLAGYTAIKIVTDAFYARGDARTPLGLAIGSVVLNVVLSALFLFGLGWDHRGLALATSIAVGANFVVALEILRKRAGGIGGRTVLRSAAKTIAATAAMSAAAWAVARALEPGDATTIARAIQVGATVATGIAVYVAAARALRIAELDEIARLVNR